MESREQELEQLRQQIAALTARVHRLEAAAGIASASSPGAGHAVPLGPPAPAIPAHSSIAAPSEGPLPAPAGRRGGGLQTDGLSLEAQIGSQWLNRIGIVAVLIGVSYFLRYAFENNWIGPSGRIAFGLLAGIGVVLWSERFRRNGYLAFSWSLKAVGIGTLYLSLWAAFQLYRLVPVNAAFAAMAAVTASAAVLALQQNAGVLAAYALLGGYATPVLLSTGVSRPVELFLYLAVLNAGVLAIVRYRPWTPLLGGAFLGTLSLYTAWHVSFFTTADRTVALGFTTLFFVMFAAAPLLVRTLHAVEATPGPGGRAWTGLAGVVLLLLPLANAGAYFLQLLTLLAPLNVNFPPLAALLLAAVHLLLGSLLRTRPAEPVLARTLALLHVAVALGLVTIAIPLKLDAHWMTLGWLIEAGALLWIAHRAGSALVMRFGIVALGLAILRLLVIDDFETELVLLNQRFATFAMAMALLGAIAATGRRRGSAGPAGLGLTTIAFNALALVALSREVDAYFLAAAFRDFDTPITHASAARDFAYSAVWMGYGALVMAAGFVLRWAMLRWQALFIVGVAILKVFAYDLSNLDQAYRILSFIVLGLLLLAISFAYQRDWLNLRRQGGESGRAQSV